MLLRGWGQWPEARFTELRKLRVEKWTYFALGLWTGRIKIGQSNNPWRRMGELMSERHGEQAKVLAVVRGEDFEMFYHDEFAEHRLQGEWFAPHPDILSEIESLKALEGLDA